MLAFMAVGTSFIKYSEFYNVEKGVLSHKTMLVVKEIIDRKEKEIGRRPTIAYYKDSEKGEHIMTSAVAGTKYWSSQAGMTPEMEASQERDIFDRKPDFIVINKNEVLFRHRLEKAGYMPVIVYEPWPGRHYEGEGDMYLYEYPSP